MNPSNFVPAIHFQSICKRWATLDYSSPTMCDHVKKFAFFLTPCTRGAISLTSLKMWLMSQNHLHSHIKVKSVSLTFQLKRGDLFFKVAPLHPFGPNFFPFNFRSSASDMLSLWTSSTILAKQSSWKWIAEDQTPANIVHGFHFYVIMQEVLGHAHLKLIKWRTYQCCITGFLGS